MRPAVASRRLLGVGALAVLAMGLWPGAPGAHEERLVVGRIDRIEPARKLLVLVETRGGRSHRLEVNQETEIIACRSGAGLGVLQPGAMVRVKYLDRAGAPSEVKSVLLLGSSR